MNKKIVIELTEEERDIVRHQVDIGLSHFTHAAYIAKCPQEREAHIRQIYVAEDLLKKLK